MNLDQKWNGIMWSLMCICRQQSWANSILGQTKKSWSGTKNWELRPKLARPNWSDRRSISPDGQNRCQIKKKLVWIYVRPIFWSGPDRYLPNSDSTCHPPTWVERTSFFAERENTRKCHSFLKKANQNFDVKIIKNEKSENFAFLPAGSFSWLRLRTRTTFWGSKLPVSWTQVCNNEVSLLLGILICHIFALENAQKIGILVPLFVMSISLIDQIVMKM